MEALICQAMEAHRSASLRAVQALRHAARRGREAAEQSLLCIDGSRALIERVAALRTSACRVPGLMPRDAGG